MTDENRIRELLEEVLNSGRTPEEVCAECRELLPMVRARLRQMRHINRQLDALFPSASRRGAAGAAAQFNVGKLPQIAVYDALGVLGRGGMGVVYKMRDRQLNRIVALKMMRAVCASPEELSHFVRRAKAIAALQHPHIAQVFDAGELDGRPYFTMELIEGGNLAQALAAAPQTSTRSARLAEIMANAMEFAHQHGIVHGNLKAANILLTEDGKLKIADFGLAMPAHEGPERTERRGPRIPHYMAPERAVALQGSVGPAMDVYSLGALLYEMLTGRPPFRAETAAERARQIVAIEAVPPSQLMASVPRDLQAICLKCLHNEPHRRYASAKELADELRRFLEAKPLRKGAASMYEHLITHARERRTIVILVVLLAGIAATVAWLWWP